jgi:hypothetical protein
MSARSECKTAEPLCLNVAARASERTPLAPVRSHGRGLRLALASMLLLMIPAAFAQPVAAPDRPTLLIVVGAPGEAEYGTSFTQQLDAWRTLAGQAGATFTAIGAEAPKPNATDRDQLQQALAAESKTGAAELWVVLVGHGTFDGKEAKFNLRGPDFSATELAEWLKPIQRPLAIIDTSSASAPFLAKLAGKNRVVVSSTRSGYEQNYARFGQYFAEAMANPASDLDKDGQVSLLEAFLTAAQRTTEFYKTEGRLATEHALIDDNGDGLGTPADWFRGVRATKRAKDGAPLDGPRAHHFYLVRSAAELQLPAEMRARRDQLELQISELREAKPKMNEDEYYRKLEKLLLDVAALYEGT